MKKSLIVYVLGWVLAVIGAMFALPMIIAFIYHESDFMYFGFLAACCMTFGLIATRFKPKNPQMYAREGFIAL